jgi:hypothetical protein
MRPKRTMKKRIVCRRRPNGVGQPPLDVLKKKLNKL